MSEVSLSELQKAAATLPARLLDALQCRHEQLLLAADPLRQHYSVFACRTEPALASLRSAWDDALSCWSGAIHGISRRVLCPKASLPSPMLRTPPFSPERA